MEEFFRAMDEADMEESPNWDDWVQAVMSWSCGSQLSHDEVGAIHQMFLDELNDEADSIIEEFLGMMESGSDMEQMHEIKGVVAQSEVRKKVRFDLPMEMDDLHVLVEAENQDALADEDVISQYHTHDVLAEHCSSMVPDVEAEEVKPAEAVEEVKSVPEEQVAPAESVEEVKPAAEESVPQAEPEEVYLWGVPLLEEDGQSVMSTTKVKDIGYLMHLLYLLIPCAVCANEKGFLSKDVGGLNAEMLPTHPQERSTTEEGKSVRNSFTFTESLYFVWDVANPSYDNCHNVDADPSFWLMEPPVEEPQQQKVATEKLKTDVLWRRFIRSFLEQNLAKLKSSMRLM